MRHIAAGIHQRKHVLEGYHTESMVIVTEQCALVGSITTLRHEVQELARSNISNKQRLHELAEAITRTEQKQVEAQEILSEAQALVAHHRLTRMLTAMEQVELQLRRELDALVMLYPREKDFFVAQWQLQVILPCLHVQGDKANEFDRAMILLASNMDTIPADSEAGQDFVIELRTSIIDQMKYMATHPPGRHTLQPMGYNPSISLRPSMFEPGIKSTTVEIPGISDVMSVLKEIIDFGNLFRPDNNYVNMREHLAKELIFTPLEVSDRARERRHGDLVDQNIINKSKLELRKRAEGWNAKLYRDWERREWERRQGDGPRKSLSGAGDRGGTRIPNRTSQGDSESSHEGKSDVHISIDKVYEPRGSDRTPGDRGTTTGGSNSGPKGGGPSGNGGSRCGGAGPNADRHCGNS